MDPMFFFLHFFMLSSFKVSAITNPVAYYNIFIQPIVSFIKIYGYFGVFIIMMLESAALPIPSEVILPITGFLVTRGVFNLYLLLAVLYFSSFVGMAIDYYIAYYMGKDFVFKHSHLVNIKRKDLMSFNNWFNRNGPFAVFVCRVLPVVRSLISFPAGFAQMNQRKFFAYSMLGSVIWDTALVLFGYYALSAASGSDILIAVGVFAVILYVIYVEVVHKRIKKS